MLFTYDSYGRIDSLTNVVEGTSYKNEYDYGDKDVEGEIPGLIYNVKLNGTTQLTYAFDQLARLSTRTLATTSPFTTTYAYLDGSGANSTTTLLASMQNGSNAAFNYTYDASGNILTISEGATLKATYTYDKLNQLTREDNVTTSKSIDYAYEIGGNITSRSEYNYTGGVRGTLIKTYAYGYASSWKDQLVTYDGQCISYDTIGNPLTYRDGLSFTWKSGREMATVTNNGVSGTYKYNDSGIRTSKTYNGVTTDYTLNGSRIVRQDNGTTVLDFFYDENGNLYGFKEAGAMYYYVRNGQSDIIGILNSAGTSVVSYTYDSWGNPLTPTGSLASTIGADNPFRYRGYYLDSETGLYYLNSRYYDSVTGRFINLDVLVNSGVGFFGLNMYAYCVNNPVNMFDFDGQIPKYINSQKNDTVVNMRGVNYKLGQLKWGILGNMYNNGCGVIALYNVVISDDENYGFELVRARLWALGGPLAGGLMGANPYAIGRFLYLHYRRVLTSTSLTMWAWSFIASKSDKIIIAVKWKGELSTHYFAGIKTSTGKYIFYNSGITDRTEISIKDMMVDLYEVAEPLWIIGVKGKRSWW